jgi:thymidylate synthase
VIWNKPEDNLRKDGQPCLQRIWFKVIGNTLVEQTDWRSRDLYYALDENIIGMLSVGKLVMECLNDYFDLSLVGIYYVDKCNSLHVYGREARDYEGAVKRLQTGPRKTASSSEKWVISRFGGKKMFEPVGIVKASVFDPIFRK